MRILLLSVLFSLLSVSIAIAASSSGNDPISWFMMMVGLLGGLVFFLYGMDKMSTGMKNTAGNGMRAILATLTRNKYIAFVLGAFVTMVIQSSSATTVMLVSFVQAELMTFTQSLGVILGANVGTTITAQMIAFKLTDYAMIMIVVGFGVRILAKSEKVRSFGDILLGFGMLFYGMKLMSDAMYPLRSYPGFIETMKELENPVTGILVGAAFTALVQSSSASTGVVIVLAQQNLITIEAGIPIILGANLGTCITAGLASIGTGREAKRVAVAHVMFNFFGVLLFIFWIPQFSELINSLAETFNSSMARQVANAHTIFNVTVGLVYLPFVNLFAIIILRLVPERKVDQDLIPTAWHIDDSILETPAIALQLARAEIARMAKLLGRMHNGSMVPFVSCELPQDNYFPKQLNLMEGIEMRAQKIYYLEEQIRLYLLKISQKSLSEEHGEEVSSLISIVDAMERIGAVIARQVLPLVTRKKAMGKDFSEEGTTELIQYHEKVGKQLKRLEESMLNMDVAMAQKVHRKKIHYSDYDSFLRNQHLQRLLAMKEETVETHVIHMELMDAMNNINIYCFEIAENIIRLADKEERRDRND